MNWYSLLKSADAYPTFNVSPMVEPSAPPDEKEAVVLQLHDEGRSLGYIAKAVRMNPSYVKDVLKKNMREVTTDRAELALRNLRIKKMNQPNLMIHHMPWARLQEEIVRMYGEGKNLSQIAALTGLSDTTVGKALLRAGVRAFDRGPNAGKSYDAFRSHTNDLRYQLWKDERDPMRPGPGTAQIGQAS
jgi:DNA-binding NarL/FixJ family response regulator